MANSPELHVSVRFFAAAKAAGPVPFEPPHLFRARMRDVTKWMQEKGISAEK